MYTCGYENHHAWWGINKEPGQLASIELKEVNPQIKDKFININSIFTDLKSGFKR